MTVTDRLVVFAQLLGFTSPVFDNVDDAQAFIALAQENIVMKQFSLYLEFVEDKVNVSVKNTTSKSTKLTWSGLSTYSVDVTGTIKRL